MVLQPVKSDPWGIALQVQKMMVMSSFRLTRFAFDAYFKACVKIVIDGAWKKESSQAAAASVAFADGSVKMAQGGLGQFCSFSSYGRVLEAMQWCMASGNHSAVILTDIILLKAIRIKAPASGSLDVLGWFVCSIVIL